MARDEIIIADIGSYALVNGLNMYYEIHGNGRPLIMLHGGVGASEMFADILPTLAETREVISVHLQTHGRTADVDRPLRFEIMAEDVAALMSILLLKVPTSWATRSVAVSHCRPQSDTRAWFAGSYWYRLRSREMDGTPRFWRTWLGWVPRSPR
jgi:hypothetical protein